MKINVDLLLSYSLAIGIFNLLFTVVITLFVSCWIFHFPLTWKLCFENYVVGYVVLWVLNLRLIKK